MREGLVAGTSACLPPPPSLPPQASLLDSSPLATLPPFFHPAARPRTAARSSSPKRRGPRCRTSSPGRRTSCRSARTSWTPRRWRRRCCSWRSCPRVSGWVGWGLSEKGVFGVCSTRACREAAPDNSRLFSPSLPTPTPQSCRAARSRRPAPRAWWSPATGTRPARTRRWRLCTSRCGELRAFSRPAVAAPQLRSGLASRQAVQPRPRMKLTQQRSPPPASTLTPKQMSKPAEVVDAEQVRRGVSDDTIIR